MISYELLQSGIEAVAASEARTSLLVDDGSTSYPNLQTREEGGG